MVFEGMYERESVCVCVCVYTCIYIICMCVSVCTYMCLCTAEKEEQFLVLDEEKAKDAAHLSSCKQLLVTSEASKPKVDRNLQVHTYMCYVTVEPLYCGHHWAKEINVSSLERCPHFRG